MPNNKIFFKQDNHEWETVDNDIKRQIVGYDANLMMVNVKFYKGGIGALHSHPHTQVTYIAEGEFEVTIGNEKNILKKGDSFFIPSNTEHGVVCKERGILVDVFSPMREDFINN